MRQPRRGREGRYSVAYNGEDVHFHWRGRGSHYIKTTEELRSYRYRDGDWSVQFELVEASEEHDNVKGKTRYFFPLPERFEADPKASLARLPFIFRPLTAQGGDPLEGQRLGPGPDCRGGRTPTAQAARPGPGRGQARPACAPLRPQASHRLLRPPESGAFPQGGTGLVSEERVPGRGGVHQPRGDDRQVHQVPCPAPDRRPHHRLLGPGGDLPGRPLREAQVCPACRLSGPGADARPRPMARHSQEPGPDRRLARPVRAQGQDQRRDPQGPSDLGGGYPPFRRRLQAAAPRLLCGHRRGPGRRPGARGELCRPADPGVSLSWAGEVRFC